MQRGRKRNRADKSLRWLERRESETKVRKGFRTNGHADIFNKRDSDRAQKKQRTRNSSLASNIEDLPRCTATTCFRISRETGGYCHQCITRPRVYRGPTLHPQIFDRSLFILSAFALPSTNTVYKQDMHRRSELTFEGISIDDST